MRIRRGIVSAAALVAAMPALAQSGWTHIGQAVAGADASSATIAAHGDPRYRQVMVCVEGHAIRLTDTILRYQDGRIQTMQLRARVPEGGCSRMSDLGGRNRLIQSAEVGYDPATLQGARATVQLFAR
ncbi:MAG TPA: hypothetical protein VGW40_03990 [Allosphingosinicella sp.]|nr:hypothetical protein [Allosphingosinicella sp.]